MMLKHIACSVKVINKLNWVWSLNSANMVVITLEFGANSLFILSPKNVIFNIQCYEEAKFSQWP